MKRLYFLILVVLVFITSCSKKERAAGDEDDIFVVADSSDYSYLHPVLDSVFGKIIFTPQPEKSFNLIHKEFSQLDEIKNLKNILIIAPLNSSQEASEFVDSNLDTDLKSKAQSGKQFVFNKHNWWAENQIVMILSSQSREELHEKISGNSVNLLSSFQKASNERITANLYKDKSEKKDIQDKLIEKYGWTIFIQQNIHIEKEQPENNLVLFNIIPDDSVKRKIFVHWINNASPEFLTADSIIKTRNELTTELSSGTKNKYDTVAKEFSTTSEINLRGKYALATQGLWETNDKTKGGPFLNYTFFDEKQKRIYMLDGSIYAPKYLKKNLIQQIDVILQTHSSLREKINRQ